jgi:CMP-2-keto-3-deoxyoctulosonic acid synthetase
MKTVMIIQARMTSNRLPGKVMMSQYTGGKYNHESVNFTTKFS